MLSFNISTKWNVASQKHLRIDFFSRLGWVGEQDEYALHGGCVVTHGVKWVANKWINIDPDYQRQIRYQQLVAQLPEEEEDEGLDLTSGMHTSDVHQDL